LRLGFIVSPPSLREAMHKAKLVADWHTSTTIQAVRARFIDSGGFARHIRKAREVYRTRHRLIMDALGGALADHLEVIPSTVGLHIAAAARTASADRIGVVARRASDSGLVVQELSKLGINSPGPPGLMLGYGTTRLPVSRKVCGCWDRVSPAKRSQSVQRQKIEMCQRYLHYGGCWRLADIAD
jgi:GntR family transcriptional regulator/MocR family aminotransferase